MILTYFKNKIIISTCKRLFKENPLNHDLRFACVKIIFQLSDSTSFKKHMKDLIGDTFV